MSKTTATDCEQIIAATPSNGTYNGTWGGYRVTFWDSHNNTFVAKTKAGIRTTNASCRVTVSGSIITVECD